MEPDSVEQLSSMLQADAWQRVLGGTEWLTERQLMCRLGGAEAHALVAQWRRERRIFTLKIDGEERFPRYLFDACYHPVPAAQTVLEILSEYPEETWAAWFESVSGFLGGKRPREILQADPQQAIAAARDQVGDERHCG
jgi:hypothetical protein